MIYRKGSIYDTFLHIIIIYTRCQHQTLSLYMFCRAVSKPEQETTISTNLISTDAQWRVCDPKGHEDFKGDLYMYLFKDTESD